MGCSSNKALESRNIKNQKENKYENGDFRENYENFVENEEKHEEDTEVFDSKKQGVIKPEQKIIIELKNDNAKGKSLNKTKTKTKKKQISKKPLRKFSYLFKKIKKEIGNKKTKKEKNFKNENLEIDKLIKSDNANININNSSDLNNNINDSLDFCLFNDLNFNIIPKYDNEDEIIDVSILQNIMTNHDWKWNRKPKPFHC